MRILAPSVGGQSPAPASRRNNATAVQADSPAGASLSQLQLQRAADSSSHTLKMRQLQAIADASAIQLAGLEEEEPLQGVGLEEEEPLQGAGLEEEEPLQGAFAGGAGTIQRMDATGANQTGMPDSLKAGVEQLSGMDMSGVRVHRNSAEPAKVGAHAYAQGTDIHLGSGQEQHLPHEAWHVVQQAQGRVQPTVQTKGVAINDDSGLEREADVMGAKAMQQMPAETDDSSTR